MLQVNTIDGTASSHCTAQSLSHLFGVYGPKQRDFKHILSLQATSSLHSSVTLSRIQVTLRLPAVIVRLEYLHCFRPEREAEQLAIRQKVRQAIMAGRVTDAQQLLHECNPDMLESVTHPNLDVLIFFHCLHYIELIRWVPQCIAKRQHIHRACAAISVTRSSCYVAPFSPLTSWKALPACPIKSCMAKIRHVSVTSLEKQHIFSTATLLGWHKLDSSAFRHQHYPSQHSLGCANDSGCNV